MSEQPQKQADESVDSQQAHAESAAQDQGKNSAQKKKSAPLRFEEKIEQLERDLADAKAKADENWEKALRTLAELDNIKKRAEKDVESAHKFAVEKFAKALVPVIDSLEQALLVEVKAEGEQLKAMRAGIELTIKMFIDATQKFGLEQINPEGEPFNPEVHEALSMMPHPDADSNTVVQVIQRGYILHGRVVRPARVIVAQ